MCRDPARYQYVLELLKLNAVAEGSKLDLLATQRVDPDWVPALECARWERLRKQPDGQALVCLDRVAVRPGWHETLGEPYVNGVQAIVSDNGKASTVCDIPSSYFAGLAQKAAASLIENGKLSEADEFRYLFSAYPQAQEAIAERSVGFDVELIDEPLRLTDRELDPLLANAVPSGRVDERDFSVLIPQAVLQEAVELTRQAGAAETGGVLIGHLHRDTKSLDIFVVVSSLIHACHTQQELTRLTFTPQTWTDVDAAIALRNQGEVHLGWWHSHPAREWCKDCPEEKRKVCKLTGDFFSAHDVALHRTCFPHAYSVALLISNSYASGLSCSLFGWRQGMVQQRGFHIYGGRPENGLSACDGDCSPTKPV